jgi:hypothetical protein
MPHRITQRSLPKPPPNYKKKKRSKMDTTPMYFYLASSSALWHRLLRRSCYRPVTRMGRKKISTLSKHFTQESCTFDVPHKLTYYAGTSVLQNTNFIQNKAGGAGNSVGLCGNSPNPGHAITSLQKSYQS